MIGYEHRIREMECGCRYDASTGILTHAEPGCPEHDQWCKTSWVVRSYWKDGTIAESRCRDERRARELAGVLSRDGECLVVSVLKKILGYDPDLGEFCVRKVVAEW